MTNETYLMIEERVQKNLAKIDEEDFTNIDERESLVRETSNFIEQMQTYDASVLEYDAKDKQRTAEIERNKSNEELEKKKQKIEVIKIAVTGLSIVVGVVKTAVKGNRMKKMIAYEETGNYSSKIGREIIQDCMRDDND